MVGRRCSGLQQSETGPGSKINSVRKTDGRKATPHWTLYDLAYRMHHPVALREPDDAERVIGHIIGGVRGVDDLYEYADEKRAALESRPPTSRLWREKRLRDVSYFGVVGALSTWQRAEGFIIIVFAGVVEKRLTCLVE